MYVSAVAVIHAVLTRLPPLTSIEGGGRVEERRNVTFHTEVTIRLLITKPYNSSLNIVVLLNKCVNYDSQRTVGLSYSKLKYSSYFIYFLYLVDCCLRYLSNSPSPPPPFEITTLTDFSSNSSST